MKPIIKFTACIVLIWLVSIASCKDPLPNHSPVASAGQDIVIVLPTCRNDTTGSTDLDGTGSTDPDNNITSYSWRRVSGPGTYYLGNSTSAKARVENMAIGEYVFELRVADAGGLSSTDNVKVIVKGTVREHDLDITFNGTFIFSEDVCFPSYYYYSNCSYYYDMTEIRGNGQFLPIGDFSINVSEYADVNDLSDAHSTFIFIYPNPGNLNSAFVVAGGCSVNFKKLINRGGGSVNGSFTVTDGSALICDANVFKNLPPLTITGNLDIVTKNVTLRVKGKVYF